MDRSFLSQPEVVQASRKFVCIRLATYESFEEAQVLRNLFVGGSGQVENTTFALLSPDGRTPLVRAGRSPNWDFSGAQDMAAAMDRIASLYPDRYTAGGADLPVVDNLRLALNVGACDHLPVVALLSDNPQQLQRWRAQLASVAWNPSVQGRAIYCLDRTASARTLIRGRVENGLVVLQSGQFGLDGSVLANLDVDSPQLVTQLTRALSRYSYRNTDSFTHIREGNARGVHWQTQIPVTDPQEGRRGPR